MSKQRRGKKQALAKNGPIIINGLEIGVPGGYDKRNAPLGLKKLAKNAVKFLTALCPVVAIVLSFSVFCYSRTIHQSNIKPVLFVTISEEAIVDTKSSDVKMTLENGDSIEFYLRNIGDGAAINAKVIFNLNNDNDRLRNDKKHLYDDLKQYGFEYLNQVPAKDGKIPLSSGSLSKILGTVAVNYDVANDKYAPVVNLIVTYMDIENKKKIYSNEQMINMELDRSTLATDGLIRVSIRVSTIVE